MNNIKNYIYWRGDLSFDVDPLNEVDALILCEFAYIDFNLLGEKTINERTLTIQQASKLWEEADQSAFMPSGYLHHKEAYDLLKLAASAERFKDLVISKDVKYFSLENVYQFGVTTFSRNEQPFFIAFEGTGLRNLGWKEDLQMSYLPEIPSQKSALSFLEEHFKEYPHPISIGGHSKGGNLAIYGGMFLEHEQDFIQKIYSFDSPGFAKELLAVEGYMNIQEKIGAFVPQDSIIGLLLHKLEQPKVVSSDATDFLQHDVFSWQVQGAHLVEDKLTNSARKIQQMLNQLLDDLTLEERKDFSEALFGLLGAGEEDYIIGDRQYILERIPLIIKEYRDLSTEGKQILTRVFRLFYRKRIAMKIEDRLENL